MSSAEPIAGWRPRPGSHFVEMSAGGRGRRCLIHLPESISGPMPLLVFLHGAGGTALWAAYETDVHRAAAARGWAVAFPEGLTPNSAKSPKFLTNPQLWNDGSPRGNAQHHAGR